MYFTGMDLNVMTLAGLSLGIGMPASLYMMYRENCRYRKSPYGSVDCSSYRQEQKKEEERGA